jgi:hypothetical protein
MGYSDLLAGSARARPDFHFLRGERAGGVLSCVSPLMKKTLLIRWIQRPTSSLTRRCFRNFLRATAIWPMFRRRHVMR